MSPRIRSLTLLFYSAVKPDESAGYQIVMSEDERQAGRRRGRDTEGPGLFAWAGNVTLQESRQLELELKETEPEDESSAADDTGNGQPVSGTEADSGETEEAAGGENRQMMKNLKRKKTRQPTMRGICLIRPLRKR